MHRRINFMGTCGSNTPPCAKRTWFIVLPDCDFSFTILICVQDCQYSWKTICNCVLLLESHLPSVLGSDWMLLWVTLVASCCSYLHTFCFYIAQHFSSNCAMPSAKNKNAETSPPLQEREQHLTGPVLQFSLDANMKNRLRSWVLKWLSAEHSLPQQKTGKQNRHFFGKFSCPDIQHVKPAWTTFFPSGKICAGLILLSSGNDQGLSLNDQCIFIPVSSKKKDMRKFKLEKK